jgi:hypothetical protein
MNNLFTPADRRHLSDRLAALQPGATRQWGKMDVAQMCAHCAAATEVAAGEVTKQQAFIGKLLGPFVKGSVLRSEKPLTRNSPTDPMFVISDPRNFEREKARLVAVTNRFCDSGPGAANGRVHSFFGRMTGDEWGVLMYKHLDHHLRQFGA